MVNTYEQVYIEKNGKISLSDVKFNNESHLLNIIQKIVQRVGRRVDETSPMVDARMPDGSRFNAIVPPLAIDGSLVSIRKFKKQKMPLSQYIEYGSATPNMVRFLEICAAIRLNILISGGTGSGKTTLLNALSGHIDPGERVITIEDAAELQMHQPHVLRLETRPPNTEGAGEITQRALVKNALRMRPDRIILGEIRGEEVIDVLQAMNTGHEGSMATIHANNPRECLSRLENLFGMSGMSLPFSTLRNQIASAIHLIVQISRMRDGTRRITQIEEIVGMETDIITTQTLFSFKATGMSPDGKLIGQFINHKVTPRFIQQAGYYGLQQEMAMALEQGHAAS
jgi:pilus assembly protein CpaF